MSDVGVNDKCQEIDFVLVYSHNDSNDLATELRKNFEENLRNRGLILEYDCKESHPGEETADDKNSVDFVKIHVPNQVLEEYCEIMKVKLPLKTEKITNKIPRKSLNRRTISQYFGFPQLSRKLFPKKDRKLMYEYSNEKKHLFDHEDENFFTPEVRISVVYYILQRTSFSNGVKDFGIEMLLLDKVYTDAYPLHDGDLDTGTGVRTLLNREWASLSKICKQQPLDTIKEYFGVQVALYFAWIGFYTKMLVPLAIVGVVCFVYGIYMWFTDPISKAICESTDTYLCSSCEGCEPKQLSKLCTVAKVRSLFDNNLTPVFAVCLAIWATTFFEFWKRFSSRLICRWNMTGYKTEIQPSRPEYEARLKSANVKQPNCITGEEELVPPKIKKYGITVVSYATILLFVCMIFIAVFAMIIFKMVAKQARWIENPWLSSVFTGLISLGIIVGLNTFYKRIANCLTNLEFQRTQTEYDNSLALKIYLFQFVNYYSSIIYVAFVRGRFSGYPGNYILINKYRQDECAYNGCFMEVTIQLVIIMVGKQIIGAAKEMAPFLISSLKNKFFKKIDKTSKDKQWVLDHHLSPFPSTGLFYEYLEMVIQFGFVTMFSVAFPLAPLCALLNNIFEIRLDADKFIVFYRRVIPVRAIDTGIWRNILENLQKICVTACAFLIAFSSNFIDKFVYYAKYDGDSRGYLNFTMSSHFNATGFECRFFDHRQTSDHSLTSVYWELLAYRLLFVILFRWVVSMVQTMLDVLIPDIPKCVRDQINLEKHLIHKLVFTDDDDRTKEYPQDDNENEIDIQTSFLKNFS